MSRARNGGGFTALRVEGGILPPEFLAEVAALQAPRQRGADYGLSKSLSIKEEIARYWRIGNDLYGRYAERRPRRDLGASRVGVEDWLVPLLRRLFGYDDLAVSGGVEVEDRVFKLTHRACGGAVPLLLVTDDFVLDKADPRLGGNGRRLAPHGLMQEYLNAAADALWGMVSNGSKLRILRDNPSLTRPSYIEADLDLIFTEELYPDFAALWLAAHASRFRPTDGKPQDCIIETWRAKSHETGERARANLRHGVTSALRRLGNGFLEHPDNDSLRAALDGAAVAPEEYFQQLLRLVYRMLFLFTAEERDLLHAPDASDRERSVYAEGYALSRLRERALRRRHYDRNADLWQGLQVTFRALARGAPGLGLPALGGLFRDDQCPDLDRAAIGNEHLLEALRMLAYFPSLSGKSLARINYRDMDTEELGSVYESLLELHPFIDVQTRPWRFAFAGDEGGEKKAKVSERKLSGSYYTPPSLVGELVRTTLDPVIARAVNARPEDPRSAILDLHILDPACGSGHFLLAAARRLAAEIARIEGGDDAHDEKARQHALREVVRHCIYGVDRNPLAVELCKTALWIEALEPGKPLAFLDAHIVLGDSLIGVLDPEIMLDGIPGQAYKALTGDHKGVCRDLKARNRRRGQGDLFDEEAVLEVAVTSIDLDAMPEETLDDVEAKRFAWEATGRDAAHAREALRANLYAGAFFAPKTRRTLKTVPLTEHIQGEESAEVGLAGVALQVRDLAHRHRFFHWHLRFAEIMQDGGFDAVLGNPPWKVSQLNEAQYFSSRSPRIAALAGATRKSAIAELKDSNPELWEDYRHARRGLEAWNHYCRVSGRYSLGNHGKLNSYALFAETCLQVLHPKGRAGLIVPTGIATDYYTRKFLEHIVASRRLATLYDFENREKVFPGIDSRIKFCLLTLSGRHDSVPEPEFAFFLRQVEQLRERERRFTLSREDFKLFKPNTRTCPTFRTRHDMEIARKMYKHAGVFWREKRGYEPEENPWGISLQQLFNMTDESDLFRTREQLEDEGRQLKGNVFVGKDEEEAYLPLYEAKVFNQYDHRFATFDGVSEKDIGDGNARPITTEERAAPETVVIPRYWVPESEVVQRLEKQETSRPWIGRTAGTTPGAREAGHQVAFRKITRATDERTSIVAVIGNVGLGDSATTIAFGAGSSSSGKPQLQQTGEPPTSLRPGVAVRNQALPVNVDRRAWLEALSEITTATEKSTLITSGLSSGRVGDSVLVGDHNTVPAVAAGLVLANMNSIPLDWAARFSVGGINMNYYIVKQLPVLAPEAYLEEAKCGSEYFELVLPRVLELTYTSREVEGFAADLGYRERPFPWDDSRRHRLQCQLDAIFASMYGLKRADLEWILDAPAPSASFPLLKQHEHKALGEYRTRRCVLDAFDQLSKGETLSGHVV